jgi:hypothetical protein
MNLYEYRHYRFDGYDEFEKHLQKPYGDPPKTMKSETVKNYLACISWILLGENITFQHLCDHIGRFIDGFKMSSFQDKDFIVKVLLSVHYYIKPKTEDTSENITATPKRNPIPIPDELRRFWEASKKTDFYHYLCKRANNNGKRYSPYTCNAYAAAILFVKANIRDDITVYNVSNIVYSFGDHGIHKEYGDIGHQTVVNALRRYREFLFESS